MVMMRSVALGRAGAAVSGLAEVVGNLCPRLLPATDRPRRGGNVEHPPVTEGAARRIGIVDHEREALRAGRRLAPVERGRLVGAVAGELRRDRLSVLKGVAGEVEFGESCVFHG